MDLASLLAQFSPSANTHKIFIPPSWHQGRTSYGGLSSVLAYQAAKLAAGDLPPLQSAQIAFVGPLAGDVEVRAQILRRGKNTAFIQVEVKGADGIGLTCNFIFMNRRESHLSYTNIAAPELPPIPSAETVRSGPPEFFTGHMQYPDKRLELGLATNRLASWHRLTEHDGLDHIAELICIGDALPPSAMGLMTEKGMVISDLADQYVDRCANHRKWLVVFVERDAPRSQWREQSIYDRMEQPRRSGADGHAIGRDFRLTSGRCPSKAHALT